VGFVGWELRRDEPMVDVRVFRRRGVSAGGLSVTTNLAAMAAVLFLLPLYLQSVEGLSTSTVGLLLLPFGAVFMVLAFAAGPATRRYGVRSVLIGGLLGMAAGTLVLAFVPDVGGSLYILAGTALFGAGAAFVAPPGTTAIMNSLPTTKAGDGSAVNQVTRQVGAALGAAVAGTVLASVYVHELSPSLGGLSADARSTAEASIDGAQKVAASLPSESLLSTADSAFASGFQVAMLVHTVLAVGTAIVVAVTLRRRPSA
jgi:predicted MFS family arabinose efflux permease